VVRGSVVDARGGEALSNVAVQLVGGAYRATSDASGRFAIASVDAGDYVLNVSTVGYRLVTKPFHLDAGETKDFDIVLSPDTFRQTDTVDVSAGPFDAARQDGPSTLELSGNDAKNLASVLADDPLRAVQSLPGVTSNNDYDARFSLRGADYSRIGLYFDGILLHYPFHTVEGTSDTGSASAFNGDMVEELELHEGAWPVRFQDRTAGVLDVHTRDGSATETSFRISASASNAGLLAEGPLGKSHRGSWIGSARKSYLQYFHHPRLALYAHGQARGHRPRRLDAREVRRHEPHSAPARRRSLRRVGRRRYAQLGVERQWLVRRGLVAPPSPRFRLLQPAPFHRPVRPVTGP